MTSRSELRQTRRNLSPKSQRHAAKSLCRIISCQLFFQRASKIVLYMPVDGEISPMPICHLAIKLGKECYLPAISNKPAEAMEFRRYIPFETPMRHNQFGIPEPVHNARHTILPWMPDIVFLPLVGFDTTGNRIGMGKGYYDRTFAKIRTRWRKPTLTGLAHSFQQTRINPQPWDIPLQKVATEKTLINFR